MTDQPLLLSDNPQAMLRHMDERRHRPSDRKLRLFACACVRLVWDLLSDERSRKAVEVAERFVDGLAAGPELEAARAASWTAAKDADWTAVRATAWAAWISTSQGSWNAARTVTDDVARAAAWVAGDVARAAAKQTQATLLRCVVGNPWRSVTLPLHACPWLTWNDGAVAKMAQSIYDGRRWDELPILADALEDAGCNRADLLAHLRDPGPHCRGCWAVDLLLGKE